MKWKIFLLWLGYIAWNIVWSAYNKKSGKKYQKELKENDNSIKFMVDNFLETQKNLFDDIKAEITSEKNKEVYEKYKNQILDIFEDYKKKSEVVLKDLKENGEEYLEKAKKSLEKLYLENKDKIWELTDIWEEKIWELKEKLTKSFEKSKKEFKNLKNKKSKK